MKSRLVTLCFREIKKNIRRFLYLAVISFLGVAVFTGIKASGADMMKTVDTYYDENNVYDIKLVSPLGLTDKDITSISKLDDRFSVYGIHSKDALFKYNGNNSGVLRIIELDDENNKILLQEGRLPQSSDEIVMEKSITKKIGLKIGDTIELNLENYDNTIKNKQLKVVGTVISPIYLTNGNGNISRGETTVGSGKVDYYSFAIKDYFNMNYYTEIYVNVANDFETNSDEYNALIDEATNKIETFKEEKGNVTWLIYNRNDSSDYTSYINSVQSVNNLSKLFPVVFFSVAVFVSLLSMSRMAFEDRGEIGALKSLGFSNMQIRYKYIIYSIAATLFGGILGGIFGFYFIPWIIYEQYSMLFGIPIFIYKNNIIPIIVGIITSIACICGSTIITINSLIKEKPTELLRPKAPPKGKKILLEKIKFFWNRLRFSNKVTARNIFRYKKRTGMTVLGIIGCTVLLISGFAIRDSIVNITGVQYGEVFKYNDSVFMSDKITNKQIEEIFNDEHIKEKVYAHFTTVKSKGIDISFIVPKDEETFKQLFILREKGSNKDLELENNKVIITSKLAKKLNLKVNDKIEFTDTSNKLYSFEISGIAQNYISDFMYMNKTTYESRIDKYSINMTYIKLDSLNNENEVTTKLMENKEVLGIFSTQASLENLNFIFKTLDTVVVILVIFSGALALVVLYNLSYINISERQREIATLKVLGFNHKEVNEYIIKEETIITIVGIIIGLIIGTWFGMMIVETIELDIAEFIKNITVISYLKALGFMVLFSIIANIRVRSTLKKIDMIESLKSVE